MLLMERGEEGGEGEKEREGRIEGGGKANGKTEVSEEGGGRREGREGERGKNRGRGKKGRQQNSGERSKRPDGFGVYASDRGREEEGREREERIGGKAESWKWAPSWDTPMLSWVMSSTLCLCRRIYSS
jgi:hypothetical protein